jgi:hypothetical protein
LAAQKANRKWLKPFADFFIKAFEQFETHHEMF